MKRTFAVIDTGCDAITALSAEWKKNGDYVLNDLCRGSSQGFREGVVSDESMAVDSIASVLKNLEKKSGKKFHDVYAGICSTSIELKPSTGVVLLSKFGREVTDRDMKRCERIGSAMKVPLDRELLHKVVSGFSLDGEKEIRNPLNLEAVKLSVNLNIVSVNSSFLHNIEKCISKAGYVPAGFVFSGLAASYRALTEEDKEKGTVLINIRKDITEAAFFHSGIMNDCRVLNTGIEDILTGDGSINKGIIKDLAKNIMSIHAWDRTRKVVIIGEGSLQADLIETMENILPCPVKVGTCITKPFEDLPPDRRGYIGSLGILDYLKEKRQKNRPAGNVFNRVINSILRFLDSYF